MEAEEENQKSSFIDVRHRTAMSSSGPSCVSMSHSTTKATISKKVIKESVFITRTRALMRKEKQMCGKLIAITNGPFAPHWAEINTLWPQDIYGVILMGTSALVDALAGAEIRIRKDEFIKVQM